MIEEVDRYIKETPRVKAYLEDQFKAQQVTHDFLLDYTNKHGKCPDKQDARAILNDEIIRNDDLEFPHSAPSESAYLTVEKFLNDTWKYDNGWKDITSRLTRWEDKEDKYFITRKAVWQHSTGSSPEGLRLPKCNPVVQLEGPPIKDPIKSIKISKEEDGRYLASIRIETSELY